MVRLKLTLFGCFLTTMCIGASDADAQLFKRLRQRLNSRSNTTTYPNGYAIGQNSAHGYQPPVTTVRPSDGYIVNRTPRNPHEVPARVANYSDRIRLVNSAGHFSSRYYNGDGKLIRGNWHGPPSYAQNVKDAFVRSQRRSSWVAPVSTSSRTSRNSGSSLSRSMRQFNAIKAQSDAAIRQIYRSSDNRRLNYSNLYGGTKKKYSIGFNGNLP